MRSISKIFVKLLTINKCTCALVCIWCSKSTMLSLSVYSRYVMLWPHCTLRRIILLCIFQSFLAWCQQRSRSRAWLSLSHCLHQLVFLTFGTVMFVKPINIMFWKVSSIRCKIDQIKFLLIAKLCPTVLQFTLVRGYIL